MLKLLLNQKIAFLQTYYIDSICLLRDLFFPMRENKQDISLTILYTITCGAEQTDNIDVLYKTTQKLLTNTTK